MPSEFGPLTLSELIRALEAVEKTPAPDYVRDGRYVYFDWCGVVPTDLDSYRGYYDHLAIGFTPKGEAPQLTNFIEKCAGVIGQTFEGYKGGIYRMTGKTPVWVSNYGHASGWGIVGVRDEGYAAILETRKCRGW